MSSPVDIRPDHLAIVQDILCKHLPDDVKVWVFGSRANWTTKDSSDLDLALESKTMLSYKLLGALKDAFEDSSLPYPVDVVDLNRIGDSFRHIVESQRSPLLLDGYRSKQTPTGEWRASVYGMFRSDFLEAPLGSLCNDVNGIQTGPFGSQLHQKDYVATGTPIITVEHLGENRITYQEIPKVSDHDKDRLSKYALREGDIVFSRVGSVDRRALVRRNEDGWLFSGRCLRVRPNINKIDPTYLSYFFGLPSFQEYIRSIAVGATMPSLNTKILSDVLIIYPPLPEQRAIAHVLGTLDDKIELNRRINETLEAMARALFKSWFVDFDPVRAKMESSWRRSESLPGLPADLYDLFPDRLVDSELGKIPEGWGVNRIDDVAERVAMGPFGSSIKVSTFVDDGIPVISGRHLNGILLEDNEYRFITEDHAERLANANVQRGDVIFTHAGSIGQASYIPLTSKFERYVISQRQFYMRCDISKISPLFVVHFFKTPEGQHELLANTSSTGVPSIARPVTYVRSIKLCIPPKPIWGLFDEIVGDFHLNIGWNTAESSTLANQRDTLLPLLVSGEVGVREVTPASKTPAG